MSASSPAFAAFARTGNGANIHLAVFDTNQNFWAGTNNAEIFKLQIEQIGRGVHAAQCPVQIKWRQGKRRLKRWLMTT